MANTLPPPRSEAERAADAAVDYIEYLQRAQGMARAEAVTATAALLAEPARARQVTLSDRRRRQLEQLVARKRRRHAELRRPTIAGLQRVCARESIALVESLEAIPPAREAGYAFAIAGAPCIVLDPRPRPAIRIAVALHELAHVWLGHVVDNPQARFPAGSLEREATRARCELEADFVAGRLLGVDAKTFRVSVMAALERERRAGAAA